MGGFLMELLCFLVAEAVEEAIPQRLHDRFVGLLMTIAGVSFIAFAGFAVHESVRGHAAPLGAGMVIVAVLLLSVYCFKIARNGFRS
jgi:hypothetical protein